MLHTARDKPLGGVKRRVADDVVGVSGRREKIEGDLAVTAIVKIRDEDSAAGFFQHLRHGAVAACALPNVTAEFFVVDQCERCPTRGGVKVRAIQVGETLNVGLKPPFKL